MTRVPWTLAHTAMPVTAPRINASDQRLGRPRVQHDTEEDVWQVDPVTSRIRTSEALQHPVIVVVEETPSLSLAITEICDFLHVGIACVTDPRHIPELLQDVRPIAIMHEAQAVEVPIYDLLMVVANYDPGLPVLIIISDDPRHRSAIEAAQLLWQVTDVVRVGQRPGIRALIEFLFRAGRKFGRTRFMPI